MASSIVSSALLFVCTKPSIQEGKVIFTTERRCVKDTQKSEPRTTTGR